MAKKTTEYEEWTEVKGLKPVTIIGTADRFSIHIPIGDYAVQVNGCRIVKGKKGKFVSFPAWLDQKKDKWHDYAYVNFGDDQDKLIDMFD